MLTIFTTPRPFRGLFDRIQRNAIRSWMQLRPQCEIILIEDEEGTTSKVAEEYGLTCIRNIKQNENGSLYLNDVFERVRERASFDILAQVNSDIILLSDFLPALKAIPFPLFYVAGQRWNLDFEDSLDFSEGWEKALREKIKTEGELHPPTGMDYWIFPKKWNLEMPSFIVGRPAVDNWLIQEARRAKIPAIDATKRITIIHQNHPRKTGSPIFEAETQWNRKLAKGDRYDPSGANYTFLLDDTDYTLAADGPRKKNFRFKKIWKYRQDVEVLDGPKVFWKLAFSPYRPAKWMRQRIKNIVGRKRNS